MSGALQFCGAFFVVGFRFGCALSVAFAVDEKIPVFYL